MKRIRTMLIGHLAQDQLAVNGIDTGVTVGDVLELHDFAERLAVVAAQWRSLQADDDPDERRVAQVERDWQSLVARWNRP